MKRSTKVYIIVIVLLIIAAVAYFYEKNYSSNVSAFDNKPVSAQQLTQLSAIANNYSLASQVGTGAVADTPVRTNSTNLITLNGTPYVVYVGADYCPYCAITRWGLVLALMRFGNFTSLHYMTSSASDVFPNTATFTFYNSSYDSRYIGFMEAETLGNVAPYAKLQQLNSLETSTFDKYDLYNNALPAALRGGIPFIDFGNYSTQSGAPLLPTAIQYQDWNKVISQISSANTTQSQDIIGMANVFTAQICAINGNIPASVCNQPAIKKIE